jgi:putative DNA primase/helicase
MTAPAEQFAEYMPIVARRLLGEPNPHHSKPGHPRWGKKGSMAIDETRGVWHDHENKTGGGVLDLVERERKLKGAQAIAWLQSIGCPLEERQRHATPTARAKRKVLERYDYFDLDGTLILQTLRMGLLKPDGQLQLSDTGKPEKTFGQRCPCPGKLQIWRWGSSAGEYMRSGPGDDWRKFNDGGWAKLPASRERKTFEAAKPIPYRLPELTEAIGAGYAVFIAEGEQKVDALAEWNLQGTCNAGGAGKWTAAHASYFKEANVVILPDNDKAGREHAEQVARSLIGIATRIRLLELPDLEPKGDFVDWKNAGHTREELDELIEQAPDWRPTDPAPTPESITERQAAAAHSLPTTTAAAFKMAGVEWLWPKRFALGKLGLLAGLPDRGKGLILADMAARVTKGDLWPCEEGRALKGSVLLLSAEDAMEDTIVPRLVAAGADLDRVHIAQMVREGEAKRMFNLAGDLELLRHKLDEIGDVLMVQIDPMSAYLGVGKMDSYRTTDVRGVLAPLVELAAEKQVLVLGVMHFNKKSDVDNAMLRISDSLAFAATARHCYVVVDDPGNERRLLVKAKNNLAPDTRALAFGVNAVVVGQDERSGSDIWAPRIVWASEHVDVTATEAMQAEAGTGTGNSAKSAAEAFLKETLASGPVSKRDIEEAAEANGIAERTLFRAKAELGILAKKSGFGGGWTWQLPNAPAPVQQGDK